LKRFRFPKLSSMMLARPPDPIVNSRNAPDDPMKLPVLSPSECWRYE
jgi:hypothetical protein